MHFDADDAWASPYIGLPYVKAGRTLAGPDCWGLVLQVFSREFGIKLPDFDAFEYATPKDATRIGELIQSYMDTGSWKAWKEVPVADAKKGDVLVISMRSQPMHCSIVIKPGIMLHATEDSDSVAEDYTSFRWKRRIVGAYRYGK